MPGEKGAAGTNVQGPAGVKGFAGTSTLKKNNKTMNTSFKNL